MKDLQALIKELEVCSLHVFKEHRNARYNFLVLFFAPDDYHSYIGFNKNLEVGEISVSVGNFYVNTLNLDLFIDSPSYTFEISEKLYRQAFRKFNTLDVYQPELTVQSLAFSTESAQK